MMSFYITKLLSSTASILNYLNTIIYFKSLRGFFDKRNIAIGVFVRNRNVFQFLKMLINIHADDSLKIVRVDGYYQYRDRHFYLHHNTKVA